MIITIQINHRKKLILIQSLMTIMTLSRLNREESRIKTTTPLRIEAIALVNSGHVHLRKNLIPTSKLH